jgi:hypothetical protein
MPLLSWLIGPDRSRVAPNRAAVCGAQRNRRPNQEILDADCDSLPTRAGARQPRHDTLTPDQTPPPDTSILRKSSSPRGWQEPLPVRPLTCVDVHGARSPGRRSFYPSPTRSLAWFDNKAQVGDDSARSLVQSRVVQWRCVLPRLRHFAGWKLAGHALAELIEGSSLASITLQPRYTCRGIPRVTRWIDLSPAADGPTTPTRRPQRRRQNPRNSRERSPSLAARATWWLYAMGEPS